MVWGKSVYFEYFSSLVFVVPEVPESGGKLPFYKFKKGKSVRAWLKLSGVGRKLRVISSSKILIEQWSQYNFG